MNTYVETQGEMPLHTALSYDESISKWVVAQDTQSLIVVTNDLPFQEDGNWYASVLVSGRHIDIVADEDIPDQGGFLHIRNGGAYADNSSTGCGTIAPLERGGQPRVAGAKVTVHLR